MGLLDGIAESIARMEGFYRPQSLARRNNNPGNIRIWRDLPRQNGFVHFPDEGHGWAALRELVSRNIDRGLTLYEFFAGKPGVYAGYAPAADRNQPRQYAEFVARRCSIDPDRPLRELV
jgi:hypothetical protein